MPDHPQMSELADEHGMDLHYGRKEKPHVHEWALELEEAHGGQFYCAAHCTICHLEMPTDETNRRLNATERLSGHIAKEQVRLLEIFAENPDSFPYPTWFRVEAFALQAPMFAAYASALEKE